MAARREGDKGEGLEAEGAAGRAGGGGVTSLKVEAGAGRVPTGRQELGRAGCLERSHLKGGRHSARSEGRRLEEPGARPEQAGAGPGAGQRGSEEPMEKMNAVNRAGRSARAS